MEGSGQDVLVGSSMTSFGGAMEVFVVHGSTLFHTGLIIQRMTGSGIDTSLLDIMIFVHFVGQAEEDRIRS